MSGVHAGSSARPDSALPCSFTLPPNPREYLLSVPFGPGHWTLEFYVNRYETP